VSYNATNPVQSRNCNLKFGNMTQNTTNHLITSVPAVLTEGTGQYIKMPKQCTTKMAYKFNHSAFVRFGTDLAQTVNGGICTERNITKQPVKWKDVSQCGECCKWSKMVQQNCDGQPPKRE